MGIRLRASPCVHGEFHSRRLGDPPSIGSPTLVVHGDADTITPVQNGHALAEAIPGAEYLEVHGGRHAPHLDHPHVVDAVVNFMSRHPLSNA